MIKLYAALGLVLGVGAGVVLAPDARPRRPERPPTERVELAPPQPLGGQGDLPAMLRRIDAGCDDKAAEDAALGRMVRFDVILIPSLGSPGDADALLTSLVERIAPLAATEKLVAGIGTDAVSTSKQALANRRAADKDLRAWLTDALLIIPSRASRRHAATARLLDGTTAKGLDILGLGNPYPAPAESDWDCRFSGTPDATASTEVRDFVRTNFYAADQIHRWLAADDDDLRRRVCFCLVEARRVGTYPQSIADFLRTRGWTVATAILCGATGGTKQAVGPWTACADDLWVGPAYRRPARPDK